MIAYNSRTNALALMEKQNYNKYIDYVEKGIPIDDEKLVEDLKRGGFLIEDNIDELELLRFNLWRARFDERNTQKNIFMSKEVQNKILEYIEK